MLLGASAHVGALGAGRGGVPQVPEGAELGCCAGTGKLGMGKSSAPQVQEKYGENGSTSLQIQEIPSCFYVSPHSCVK